eukprot:Seg2080.5_Seg2080.7 transcript_id=Seg2080.5_Seg2080.7/GoldUCD/mRNA.D3Y31 product="Kinetochore protein NDC80" protein_id=Seg2080.5_Seg2080.7/GoldUCD/D3Y31
MKRTTPSSSRRDPVRKKLSGIFGKNRDSLASNARPSMSSASFSRNMSRRWADQGPLKDPRNLSNKARQREMIDDVLNFLQMNGYQHQISQKLLQAPTSKDFVRIFEFLYGFIDKDEKIDRKFEEEVPRLLKQQRYPFPIAKSAMFTIGSLHTWPTLLGALHWLVKLIEVGQRMIPEDFVFSQDEDDPIYGSDRTLHYYYSKTFKHFMNNIVDTEEDDERFTRTVLQQAGADTEDTEELDKEVAALERRLAELEDEPDRLKEMKDEITIGKSGCEKMERARRDFEHQEKIRDEERLRLKEELRKYPHQRILQIQSAGSLELQKETLANRFQALELENKKIQAKCWESEMNFSKTYRKVDKVLSEYNDLQRNIAFDKLSLEYLEGHDISMKFDHQQTEFLNPSKFRDTIKDVLIQAQNKAQTDLHQLESQRITEEEKLEKLTDLCAEKDGESVTAQAKLDTLAFEVEETKEKYKQELEDLKKEMAAITEEIKVLESGSSSLLEEKQKELVLLKERVETERKEMDAKMLKAADFLGKVIKEAAEHKTKIQARLGEMETAKKNQLEELQKMEPIR